jgi:hypothetical protein
MRKIWSKFRIIPLIAASTFLTIFYAGISLNRAMAQNPGTTNHIITLRQATQLIQNFKKNPTAPSTQGGYFGRNIFETILAQPGCIGIRYYYAADSTGSPTIVLVGVDSSGNDMEEATLGEFIFPCPPYCGSQDQLNK